jgi:peptidoglycan biosynthesis protein MviN/MurJ (putative lipid II flippase)
MASTLVYNAFYSIKAYKQDLWLTVSMLILNSGLPFLFTMIMKPVDGAAMGWLMACFLFFIIMVLTLRKQLKSPNLIADDDISGLNPVAAD